MIVKIKQKKQQSGLPPPPPPEELEEMSQVANMQDSSGGRSAQSDLEQQTTTSATSNIGENLKSAGADDDEDDEMDMGNFNVKAKKKRKKGIIYISNIPKHMNVTRMREILGEYAELGRVYLQPEKLPGAGNDKKKKRKRLARHFTEGWVEFESKRAAKQIVELLNNKQISTRKKSQFYDYMWSMKYLPRFKWVHLTERMNYEQAVHKQRLHTEVSQARKETTFFQNNLDKSEYLKKQSKKANKGKNAAMLET
ncbi:PREDICTED: pre-rRNA-processing protein esf2-like isoform X1 [Bactrocera latifrons]|uniref:Activator of basal transcription 1 n=1 Tax=Bactrocera latifrons TaxID=174628 RepID=A0A0K8UPE3_BACLA|nr:PREDICTED: pre-rRNA-processing protein esf2-like isoform X1 [Bactrocera latifrons]